MARKTVHLSSPFSLKSMSDGAGYQIPPLKLSQPNLFTRLGSLGDLIVKVPSDRGRSDFEKYVKRELTDPQDIRRNESIERFQNLSIAVERYPTFMSTRTLYGDDVAHFLIVHRLQHARLEAAALVGIPNTRFVVLEWPRWLFGRHSTPAIVQERVRGIRLLDMVEPIDGIFLSRFSHLKSALRDQLKGLVDSALSLHIDWNIQNFIWQEAESRLYYVDSKPSTLTSRFSVEHNLASLRETFLG